MSPPKRLGKYEIVEVLGEGAMGVVYKAFDPDIRRPVALKTIRRQLTDGSDFAAGIAARFRNEAQAAGRLAHPNIVSVYEYGEDDSIAYIAMEFVEGRSIDRCLASQIRFTDEDVAGIMCQMLDALEHAHKQAVWHRDIKPANVILSLGGTVKVADFGIARMDAGGLTQANTVIGTPAYMAPEQFLGTAIDARVDVYAAGVVLYVLLTGRPPFSGTPESLLYKAVHEMPLPPSRVESGQRPGFYDDLVARAMAKSPDGRFASAGAFKSALVAAVGQPIDTTAWEKTIVRASPRTDQPSAAAAVSGSSAVSGTIRTTPSGEHRSMAGSASAPPSWDRKVLAEAEHTLAHYVGPLATLLVKRVARECDSVPALYARLAEQVTDPAARKAFLGKAAATATMAVASASHAGTSMASGTGAKLSEELLDRVQRRLAQEIGPMARIIVKKAAAEAGHRTAFMDRIASSVVDPKARATLLADLDRLP